MNLLSIRKIKQKEQLENHYIKMFDNSFAAKYENTHLIYLVSSCLEDKLFFKEFYQSLFVRSLSELINVTDIIINYKMFSYTKERALEDYLNNFNYRISNYSMIVENYKNILNHELTAMLNNHFVFPDNFFDNDYIKSLFSLDDDSLNNFKILNKKNILEKKLNKSNENEINKSKKIKI